MSQKGAEREGRSTSVDSWLMEWFVRRLAMGWGGGDGDGDGDEDGDGSGDESNKLLCRRHPGFGVRVNERYMIGILPCGYINDYAV